MAHFFIDYHCMYDMVSPSRPRISLTITDEGCSVYIVACHSTRRLCNLADLSAFRTPGPGCPSVLTGGRCASDPRRSPKRSHERINILFRPLFYLFPLFLFQFSLPLLQTRSPTPSMSQTHYARIGDFLMDFCATGRSERHGKMLGGFLQRTASEKFLNSTRSPGSLKTLANPHIH